MVDAFKITLPFLNSKSHYPSQIQNHTTLPKPACVPLSHPIGSGTYRGNLHTPSHTCSLTQRPHTYPHSCIHTCSLRTVALLSSSVASASRSAPTSRACSVISVSNRAR